MNEVCADFVRLLLGRMAQRVPTMITLQKITRDHGEEKFGEFRSSIIGMLDNTRYEQSILTTAKELLANTKFEQVSKLHRGQTRAIGKVEVWDPLQSDARERSNSEMDATTRLSAIMLQRLRAARKRSAKSRGSTFQLFQKTRSFQDDGEEDAIGHLTLAAHNYSSKILLHKA